MSQKSLPHLPGPRQVFLVGGSLIVCTRVHNKTKAALKMAIKWV